MNPGTRNLIVILLTIAVCIGVQHIFVPVSKLLPPLMVRFILGWGLAISVGVVCASVLHGPQIQRLLLMLCVPIGWLAWYYIVAGVEPGAQTSLLLYVLYSTGFMIVGFLLGSWYQHLKQLSRQH